MALASKTIKLYDSILLKLQRDSQLQRYPDGTIKLFETLPEYLTKHVININSRRIYLYAIIHAIRDWPEENKKVYRDMANDLQKSCAELGIKQQLPDKRANNMLKWSEVLDLKSKAKDMLPKQDYLIYCLYTLQPPVRADYVNMSIRKYLTDSVQKDISRNYCILQEHSYFIFNQYKTAKTYGQIKIPICDELADIIKSTCANKKELLSINTSGHLSTQVIRIFDRISGKKMGIGLLRHSFITKYLSTARTILHKESIARQMMHSWVLQEMYHIISDDEEYSGPFILQR